MIISLIAAATKNRVIGHNGDMPWHLPNDLKFFKRITLRHHIIMGRKTFESFGNGKPLPRRTNIILTRNTTYTVNKALVANDLAAALQIAKDNGETEVFIVGGEQIYIQAFPLANKIYLTEIDAILEGDTFFPEISNKDWKLISEEKHPADAKHAYPYNFTIWERK